MKSTDSRKLRATRSRGSHNMAQNGSPCIAGCFLLAKQFARPVSADSQGINLKRKLVRINIRFHVSRLLGAVGGAAQHLEPSMHHFGNTVPDWTRTAIELKRRRGKKAATGKNTIFHMAKPAVAQLPQSRHALWTGQRRSRHMLRKNLLRSINGGELQFFFGPEVGEQ